jgi:hypothetical protein
MIGVVLLPLVLLLMLSTPNKYSKLNVMQMALLKDTRLVLLLRGLSSIMDRLDYEVSVLLSNQPLFVFFCHWMLVWLVSSLSRHLDIPITFYNGVLEGDVLRRQSQGFNDPDQPHH